MAYGLWLMVDGTIRHMPSAISHDQKRIGPPLLTDRRVRTVAGMDDRGVAERKQYGADRRHQDVVVAAGEVGSTDRPGEQRVADEQFAAGRTRPADLQAHAAGAVA